MRPKRHRALRPHLDRLDDRCLLSASPQGLSPSQLQTAYGLNNLYFYTSGASVPADGRSQTIALIEVNHDPYLASDLATFDATYGLSTPAPLGQNAAGKPWLYQFDLAGSTTDSGWAQEETLDVEWTHAMAPGANILVVEAASGSTADLLQAVAVARATPGVTVVSMSWGIPEFPGEANDDVYFTTPPGHVGITYVAASGDSPGVEWPAASPNVLSVGGTTLSTSSATGAYLNESVWHDSGGGYSVYEPEPSYQYSLQSTGRRSVPDVAFDANPNTGVSVYTTDPTTGIGSWSVFGGTSLGAPSWAAIVAIVDEGYALAHIVPSMDGLTQTLPILYSRPADTFHTVFTPFYSATASVTQVGLGTPDGTALINSLLGGNILTVNGPVAGSVIFSAVGLATASASQLTTASAASTAALTPLVETPAADVSLPLGPGQSVPTDDTDSFDHGRVRRSSTRLRAIPAVKGAPAAPAARPDVPAPVPDGSTTPPTPPAPASAPAAPAGAVPDARPAPAPEAAPAPKPAATATPTGPLGFAPSWWPSTAPVVSTGVMTLAPLQSAPALDLVDAALRSWDDE